MNTTIKYFKGMYLNGLQVAFIFVNLKLMNFVLKNISKKRLRGKNETFYITIII